MSSPGTASTTRLAVAKDDFIQELKRLAKVLGRRRNAADALLRYEEGQLRISIGGAEVGMTAQGQWQGEARVSAAWLRAFAKVPPPQDPVVIQVEGSRMRIGGSSIACQWQVPGAATVEIPLNLDLRERIRLAFSHPHAELEKSGLAPMVVEARAELEKRIAAAAQQLAPCGVTETDIRLLVEGKMGLVD